LWRRKLKIFARLGLGLRLPPFLRKKKKKKKREEYDLSANAGCFAQADKAINTASEPLRNRISERAAIFTCSLARGVEKQLRCESFKGAGTVSQAKLEKEAIVGSPRGQNKLHIIVRRLAQEALRMLRRLRQKRPLLTSTNYEGGRH
jgi:hypothetical protein